jgi:benzoyl-CoA reductase subunit D
VVKAEGGITFLSGGLALDEGLVAALSESLAELKLDVAACNHADSPYAGAISAALWGAFRYEKLVRSGMFAKAS